MEVKVVLKVKDEVLEKIVKEHNIRNADELMGVMKIILKPSLDHAERDYNVELSVSEKPEEVYTRDLASRVGLAVENGMLKEANERLTKLNEQLDKANEKHMQEILELKTINNSLRNDLLYYRSIAKLSN